MSLAVDPGANRLSITTNIYIFTLTHHFARRSIGTTENDSDSDADADRQYYF